MAAYGGFMTHVTCRLTAKNRDQLRNPTLGNRVFATFTIFRSRIRYATEPQNVSGGTDVLGKRKSVPGKIRIRASIFTSIFMLFYINIPHKLIVSDAVRIAIKHECIFKNYFIALFGCPINLI